MKLIECFVRSIKLVQDGKTFSCRILWRNATALLLFFTGLPLLHANPSGGSVAAGSASISGTGTTDVTINQSSRIAIINWNSFSLGQGDLTTFIQPSSSSAVLNRVTGGGLSSINGMLNANGQVFLINGNGILIGQTGVINTAGFTASTRDITNSDFLSGKDQFTGNSANGVQNLGTINAIGGDIYLIGRTVDNEGALNASSGTVGLAAGESVLIKQTGDEHVFVSPVAASSAGSTATGVNNFGAIAATAAELRAANGNMYALAINNGGTIRATTVKNQGGHIWLTSDSGTIVNTGAIDASATAAQGTGGQITLKTGGTVVNRGQILAHGGQGGAGGTVDLSGNNLDFAGGVDLTTPGGTTGNLLLDPTSITVINDPANPQGNGVITTTGTTTTYTPAPNYPGPELLPSVLDAQLELANVIVDGINKVTIADAVAWNAPTTLTLQTSARTGGAIVINAAIDGQYNAVAYAAALGLLPGNPPALPGTEATLDLNAVGNGYITTGPGGTINVDNFTLQNGLWRQIVTTTPLTAKTPPGYIFGTPLPAFNVGNDFQLLNTSTFERFAGGDGKPVSALRPGDNPYQIVDIYGLQGIGSPSDTLLANSYILDNDINYVGGVVTNTTINWNGGNGTNGGAGWVPIGEGGKTVRPFTGTFDGADHTIAGYYLYRPNDDLTGLFAEVQGGTIKNVTLDSVGVQAVAIGGFLVGRLVSGLVENCNAGHYLIEPPRPVDPSAGTTANQSELTGNLGVNAANGGLVGEVMSRGNILDSSSNVIYTLLGSSTGAEGLLGFAGLVGVNYGTITNCYSSGSGSTAVDITLPSDLKSTSRDFKDNSISLGGLVGTNFGTINGGASYGVVTAVGLSSPPEASIVGGIGNFYIGGFVGTNYGKIDGTVIVKFAGRNVTETYQAFTTDDVTGPVGGNIDGGTGSYYVGGFAGANYGSISNAYSAPIITGLVDNLGNTLTQGGIVTGNGNLIGPSGGSTGALGDYVVGGFAGGNFGKIISSGTEDTVISNGNIEGIANVTSTLRGVTTTVPATVVISNPLALDSIIVGGFVGLDGSGSSITGSFSDTATKTLNFNLDPTVPLVATAAPLGETFSLSSDVATNDPLVSSNGIITGGNGFYILGGLAGANYGTITTSYSTGNVTATGTTTQSNSFYLGGLVGIDYGTISNAFATGNASSLTLASGNQTGVVGGLVAEMFSGRISTTYSIGTVTGGTTRGGLVGVVNFGSVTGSFWDMTSNPNLTYSGGGAGAVGEIFTAMQTDSNNVPPDYTTSIYGTARWNFKTIWTVGGTPALPTLQHVP